MYLLFQGIKIRSRLLSHRGKRKNGLQGLVHLLRVILTVVIRYSLIWMYRICSPVTVYTYRWQWRLNLTHLWAPHAERRSIINSVFAFCSSTHCPLPTATFKTYTPTEKASKTNHDLHLQQIATPVFTKQEFEQIRFHPPFRLFWNRAEETLHAKTSLRSDPRGWKQIIQNIGWFIIVTIIYV